MTMHAEVTYVTCSIDGCLRPAYRSGLCDGHDRRRRRGQVVHSPLAEVNLSPSERLASAALTFADADSEDDAAADRAWDNLRKTAVTAGRRITEETIRATLERMKAAGVRLGRPPVVTVESVLAALERHRTRQAAARALGVSRSTVIRVVRKLRVSKT